jgi:hypothetical protein
MTNTSHSPYPERVRPALEARQRLYAQRAAREPRKLAWSRHVVRAGLELGILTVDDLTEGLDLNGGQATT